MNYREVLRCQPWLQFVNKHNISFRFLKYTRGDMFVAINKRTGNYELHSVRSFKLTDSSLNKVLEDNEVNGCTYFNFRATELKKFMIEEQSRLDRLNYLYDSHEVNKERALDRSIKQIELTLGTRV